MLINIGFEPQIQLHGLAICAELILIDESPAAFIINPLAMTVPHLTSH